MTANTLSNDDDKDTNDMDEREEELRTLMNDYNINREKAEQAKKIMDRDGVDADEAVEMLEV